ncbi:tripartite tricarboxylate transporter substrate binding protein [Paracraurococcus lichenis]|uniref:Tripartite tricarboxylate transporter substrate binding protein n=1 Tax=Paracraurococcus lichenis TaxID=3064888 RepID=A0ABT9DZ31_9PROT|nr:tripartite tricarboxylate transporter substrate binding protein [Paracraurococcus sp. LOR1-02]MDO9709172.1 tripartite tricarboxylate transporter substrate binding protein [Paracraurococcus sp. LOR1-02]
MRMTRRLAIGAMLAAPAAARGQGMDWPSRPVRFVVPYPPGGPTDILGRVVAARLAQDLKQPMVVENRPGASGTIGAEQVARAAPDGQAFLMNASIHVIIPHLNRSLPFDALTDFTPVTNMASVPLVAVVNPQLPVRSIPELVAYLKANPGRVSYASSGNASALHLAGEMFKLMTGTEMLHVPYRGAGPAVQDLISGSIQLMFDSIPSSAAAVRAGLLRPLAVTTATRVAAYPDLPTIAEAGVPGFEIATWYGIWAPPRTPMPVAQRLHQAVAAAVAAPEVRERLATLGAEPVADTPEDFSRFCAREYERWGRLVREARVTLD